MSSGSVGGMVFYLLSMVLAAVRGRPRRPIAPVVCAVDTPPSAQTEETSQQIPPDLPEPPVLEAAQVEILDRTEIFRRLRGLELGVAQLSEPTPEQERILASAAEAIGDAATQRRYAPRRPNLLPQLMRAINDEDTSRRELAAIIARDPSLVGSLLKMANSAYYRTLQPVETIERAIVILGSDGLRSLLAAAVLQPIFQVTHAEGFPRFPEMVWEHAMRSAHAAIPHAALVERADGFAAELLGLISGLAEIVVFRAAMDYWASLSKGRPAMGRPAMGQPAMGQPAMGQPAMGQPDPVVMASLLDTQSAALAWRIGAEWELSELMLAALEEQVVSSEPTTPLGRSLRFGRCAGALAVLHTNLAIDDESLRLSLPPSGLSPPHLKLMWTRLLHKHEDPRVAVRRAAA